MSDAAVLVTGVARELGAAFARDLAATGAEVIGVDRTPPRHDIGLARFVRTDITSPAITRLVRDTAVGTVVHLGLVSASGTGHSRTAAKEINIVGAMQLFAACQQSPTVRKLVLQSSINVYGASHQGPARFTEDMSSRHQPGSGLGKDAVEVETYARGLARRRPDCVVTTLRLANLLGAGHQSQIARWLSLPVVPRVLGFDARLQFLHPEDAVAALRLVTERDIPGTFNVAAADIVTLSQMVGLLGRPTVGVAAPTLPLLLGTLRRLGITGFTRDEIAALTHGRAMDVSRFADAGFTPQWSTADLVADFAAELDPGPLHPDRVRDGVERLSGLVHGFAPGRRP